MSVSVLLLLLLSRQHRIGSNRSSGSKHRSWARGWPGREGGRAHARVIFTFFAGTPLAPSPLASLPASDPLASSVISFLPFPFLARFTARSCPTPATPGSYTRTVLLFRKSRKSTASGKSVLIASYPRHQRQDLRKVRCIRCKM